jgi:hypothetical protein
MCQWHPGSGKCTHCCVEGAGEGRCEGPDVLAAPWPTLCAPTAAPAGACNVMGQGGCAGIRCVSGTLAQAAGALTVVLRVRVRVVVKDVIVFAAPWPTLCALAMPR